MEDALTFMPDTELSIVPTEIENVYGVCAADRQALVDYCNQFINSSLFDGSEGRSYLHIELSGKDLGCEGCSVDYATEADIPYHSVPCACGNPKHWLIKYAEEPTQIEVGVWKGGKLWT